MYRLCWPADLPTVLGRTLRGAAFFQGLRRMLRTIALTVLIAAIFAAFFQTPLYFSITAFSASLLLIGFDFFARHIQASLNSNPKDNVEEPEVFFSVDVIWEGCNPSDVLFHISRIEAEHAKELVQLLNHLDARPMVGEFKPKLALRFYDDAMELVYSCGSREGWSVPVQEEPHE